MLFLSNWLFIGFLHKRSASNSLSAIIFTLQVVYDSLTAALCRISLFPHDIKKGSCCDMRRAAGSWVMHPLKRNIKQTSAVGVRGKRELDLAPLSSDRELNEAVGHLQRPAKENASDKVRSQWQTWKGGNRQIKNQKHICESDFTSLWEKSGISFRLK